MKKLLLLLLTVASTVAFAHDLKPQKSIILSGSAETIETQMVSSSKSSFLVKSFYTITALAKPSVGGTVSGTGTYESGSSCTLIATPAANYQFVNWTKNGTAVSNSASYTFNVDEDATYVANFSSVQSIDVTVGSGTSTNAYLPTYSYYKYAFTEQIYTAAEIGEAGVITAVSFKVSNSKSTTRKVDLYLKSTTKTDFTTKSDWEPLPSSNKVYSGNVTFNASGWTTITLTTPFVYDGTSNLIVGMDDNTASYVSSTSNSPKFYVYSTGANRALRIYGDNVNYNPAAPSTYSGSFIKSNDQIMFTMNSTGGGSIINYTVTATANPEEGGIVTGGGTYEECSTITLNAVANEDYEFVNWTKDDIEVSTNASYTFTVTEDANYEANFERIIIPTYDITVAAVTNGVISADKTSAAEGETVMLTATPNYGCVFSHWIVYETGNINNTVGVNNNKFIMPAANVTVAALFTSSTGSGNVTVTDVTIGSGKTTSSYLPTYTYYKYSLTEQIYTAAEIGQEGTITAIAFQVANSKSSTRNVDIYMKTTNKSIFTSRTGWETLTSNDLVYSGMVTFNATGWTIITLNTPFAYDGISNLLIGTDDNTGTYVSGSSNSPKFYVYGTGANRAMRIYSDNTNYNPSTATSYSGTYMTSSNQIQLTMITSDGGSINNENLFVTPDALSDFTYVYGNGPSEVQSFAIIGSDLNYAITVTAPGDYEICTTPNGTFGNTVTLGGDKGSRDGSMHWDFEGTFDGWTTIDADGDGYNWEIASESMGNYTIPTHSGSDMLFSESYNLDSGLPLTPDNWLISPEVPLGGTFTMWAGAQDVDYPLDHFGVFLSTTSNTDLTSFVILNEWTLSAKGTRDSGNWYEYTVDLSAYAGMTGYIAVRHFDCTDEFQINVDDFTLTYDDSPIPPDPIHIDYLAANVYVRLKAGLDQGIHDGTITVASGESTATVTLNGLVTGIRTGIELKTVEDTNVISLYPNPAERGGSIHIAIPEEVSMEEAKVEIYNELGALVHTEMFMGKEIPNNFAVGLYTVRIVDSKGNVYHTKLIVK